MRQYMLAHTTWLIAKTNPLKYVFEKLALTGRIAHWQMAFALAEQLAHYPLSDYQSLLHAFLDEHIMLVEETRSEAESVGWKLWFDRASNLLGNGIGAVLASLEGQCFLFSARLGFDCTNMAEYEACAMGIMMAIKHQVKELKVFDDSTLVIYQLHEE
ncbi:hypothetical protein CR513_56247, partial [Mucuna pruriens]